jgi:hypothetical protein
MADPLIHTKPLHTGGVRTYAPYRGGVRVRTFVRHTKTYDPYSPYNENGSPHAHARRLSSPFFRKLPSQ